MVWPLSEIDNYNLKCQEKEKQNIARMNVKDLYRFSFKLSIS